MFRSLLFVPIAGKGRRPSFVRAARPEKAIPLYERFIAQIQAQGIRTATGEFGADMLVSIENDGPVTIPLVRTRSCRRETALI